MKHSAILVLVLIAIALICGCTAVPSGSKGSLPATQITTPSSYAAVSIRARAFDPAILTIKPGTMVTWTNDDPMAHYVVHLPEVGQPELFNSGRLSSGQSFSYTFGEKGRYNYGDPQIGGGRSYLVIVS